LDDGEDINTAAKEVCELLADGPLSGSQNLSFVQQRQTPALKTTTTTTITHPTIAAAVTYHVIFHTDQYVPNICSSNSCLCGKTFTPQKNSIQGHTKYICSPNGCMCGKSITPQNAQFKAALQVFVRRTTGT
jgi:hypothetical protein